MFWSNVLPPVRNQSKSDGMVEMDHHCLGLLLFSISLTLRWSFFNCFLFNLQLGYPVPYQYVAIVSNSIISQPPMLVNITARHPMFMEMLRRSPRSLSIVSPCSVLILRFMWVTIFWCTCCYHSAGDSLISADPQYGKTHEVRLHDNIKLNCLASDEETPVRGARVSL